MVMIGNGEVRGKRVAENVVAYLGIPYAAPPFGPRRFAAPQPPAKWTGTRHCTAFGPIAPQSAEIEGMPRWRPGDEDVLTLNVWAPDGTRFAPVLFWVHGGANTFGSSAQVDFDGTALAQAGLVVVTCNYRLGFEGFGHVDGFPDNRGLLDVECALVWVCDEIAAFGGDPGNVTAAGQSSGATAVACLSRTGLFRQAVLHSPPDLYFTPEYAKKLVAHVPLGSPEEALDRIDEFYQPVLTASPLSAVPDDLPLLLCHTANEEPMFREPVQQLAKRHPNAHEIRFDIPPARHNDEIPYAFGHREDKNLMNTWVRFAQGLA
jgi:carboxylesterase type B